jgi:hypothetical protein
LDTKKERMPIVRPAAPIDLLVTFCERQPSAGAARGKPIRPGVRRRQQDTSCSGWSACSRRAERRQDRRPMLADRRVGVPGDACGRAGPARRCGCSSCWPGSSPHQPRRGIEDDGRLDRGQLPVGRGALAARTALEPSSASGGVNLSAWPTDLGRSSSDAPRATCRHITMPPRSSGPGRRGRRALRSSSRGETSDG